MLKILLYRDLKSHIQAQSPLIKYCVNIKYCEILWALGKAPERRADKICILNPLFLKVDRVMCNSWSSGMEWEKKTQGTWGGLPIFKAASTLSPSAPPHHKITPFLSFGFADNSWFTPVISRNNLFLFLSDRTGFSHWQSRYCWDLISVMSGWPSGLRRQTQDSIFPLLGLLVSEWRRGFESHFWQDSVLFLAHMCLSSHSCFSTFILPRLEYPLLFCSWVLSTSKDSPHQQLHPGLYSGRSWYPWKSH